MKKTSRDWIQASDARSGIAVIQPPMPVAAPVYRASEACLRLATGRGVPS